MLSPQLDISSRREGLLDCRCPQHARPSQDWIHCWKTTPQKSQEERHLGEWSPLIISFHHQWAELLKVRHLHFGGNHCCWFVDVLSLFLSGVNKRNASPCLLLCRERQRREVPVSLRARVLDRRTVTLNTACGTRCWANSEAALEEGSADTSAPTGRSPVSVLLCSNRRGWCAHARVLRKFLAWFWETRARLQET